MIKNYFKSVVRGMWKKKINSIVIVLSFALGLASINIISTFVIFEFSTDGFHEKGERIYRLLSSDPFNKDQLSTQIDSDIPPVMNLEFPEIISFCQTSSYSSKKIIVGLDEFNSKVNILETTPSFFDIFDFDLKMGDYPKLTGEILLSADESIKYFGNENPVGRKIIVRKKREDVSYTVSGILRDVSYNTHFKYDFISCLDYKNYVKGPVYLLLSNTLAKHTLEAKINDAEIGIKKEYDGYRPSYKLQPLKDVYFDVGNKWNENFRSSSFVYAFLLIGIFTLLIASFNYLNLLKLRFNHMQKEMILRKVLGEPRSLNFLPMYLELCMYLFAGLVLSGGFSLLLLDYFNETTGSKISAGFIFNPVIILSYISLFFFFSVVFIVYLYVYLNRQNRSGVFTSVRKQKKQRVPILQIAQFIVSGSLVASALIIMLQVEYVNKKELGFDRNIYEIRLPDDVRENAAFYKNEIIKQPCIMSACISSGSPIQEYAQIILKYDPSDDTKIYSPSVFFGDIDYSTVLDLKLTAGSYFDPNDNNNNTAIVNQSLANKFFNRNAVGNKVPGTDYIIVGVVKDFHYESLSSLIAPGFIVCDNSGGNILIKINPDNELAGLKELEKWWKTNLNEYPFQYHKLDERFSEMHSDISNDAKLINLFTVISIVLSVLGLIAYTTIKTHDKSKEIGIRRVLGSSVINILFWLLTDTLKWIIIASVICVPVTFDVMNLWLDNYAYRIEIGWLTFVVSGGVVLLLAITAVGYQAIKAAIANPVESLKYE